MTGLIGMFQKVYSLAAQSFLMRKNGVFNRASSSSRQAFGQLGRAVENLTVRLVPFRCVRANARPAGLKFVFSCAYEGSAL